MADRMTFEASAALQHANLRRELGRLDAILFLISAMVVVDTIGAIAIGERLAPGQRRIRIRDHDAILHQGSGDALVETRASTCCTT